MSVEIKDLTPFRGAGLIIALWGPKYCGYRAVRGIGAVERVTPTEYAERRDDLLIKGKTAIVVDAAGDFQEAVFLNGLTKVVVFDYLALERDVRSADRVPAALDETVRQLRIAGDDGWG